jgi:radical SAM superfamily enzyme YgiQ (UPF0313 family)
MNEKGTVTRALCEVCPVAAIAVSNSAKPARLLIFPVIFDFSSVICGTAATGQRFAVIDHNFLSGEGEKSVPYFEQNLVQGESWRN